MHATDIVRSSSNLSGRYMQPRLGGEDPMIIRFTRLVLSTC